MDSRDQLLLALFEDARPRGTPASSACGEELLCDLSEASSGIPDLLGQAGAGVRLCRLPMGDYLVSGRMLVERKAAGDFCSSLYDGRLFRQLAALSRAAPAPVLVVEGCPGYYERFWPPGLRGALLTAFADFKVPLMFTRRAEGTARLLLDFLRHCERRPSMEKFEPCVSGQGLARARLRMLAAIPGVGFRLARVLLERMRTLERVFKADAAQLREVPGIGRVRARVIHSALHD